MISAQADSRTNAKAPLGPRMPPDAIGRRLLWGLLVSLPVNLALWGLASGIVRRPMLAPPAPIIVRRIILAPPKATPKPPPKKIVRPAPRPKPLPPKPRRVVPPLPIPRRPAPPRPAPPKRVLPHAAARSQFVPQRPQSPTVQPRLLTAQGATPAVNTVPSNGNAPPGTPSEPSVQATPETPPPARSSEPAPSPQSTAPTPAAIPASPAHEDAPPGPPAGLTRNAQPLSQPLPEIPDELREDDYQSSVPITMQIDAEGRVTDVTLHGSSGSRELDRRIVDALKRWRWQPALQNGKPVADTRSFRFDFEVR